MSDNILTIELSDEKLSRLRSKYPRMKDAEALARVVDECLATAAPGEEDTEAIVARLREQFPDDPLVALIGMFEGDADVAARHDEFGLGSDL